MTKNIYKSKEGERLIKERYRSFLNRWPTANHRQTVTTREGDTFIVVSGDETKPPLLLFHGSASNSARWREEISAWAAHFHVYAIDMIGEPGLSAAVRPALNSEAHALWLDDVMRGLGLTRVSIVGESLGGWLAIDYATRRPDRIVSMALIVPAGIGKQKNFLLKAFPLLLLGPWGARKMRELVLGRPPKEASSEVRAVWDFIALNFKYFRTRMEKLPLFDDAALKRLSMPVLAILGGRDALFDSTDSKRRLERNVRHTEVDYRADAGHVLDSLSEQILAFLRRSVVAPR